LDAAQTGPGIGVVVPCADGFHDVELELGDFPLLAHKVEVEERAEVFLFLRRRHNIGVEPGYEEAEGVVFFVGKAEVFVATASLGYEGFAEEPGAVAEEFLMEDPVCVFDADVDVDHVTGEEPMKYIVRD
jgi:hypothetical protein